MAAVWDTQAAGSMGRTGSPVGWGGGWVTYLLMFACLCLFMLCVCSSSALAFAVSCYSLLLQQQQINKISSYSPQTLLVLVLRSGVLHQQSRGCKMAKVFVRVSKWVQFYLYSTFLKDSYTVLHKPKSIMRKDQTKRNSKTETQVQNEDVWKGSESSASRIRNNEIRNITRGKTMQCLLHHQQNLNLFWI